MDKLARKVDIHHAAMQGSYFAGFSAIWGFGPVLLLYLGLSNSTLGVVTSLALVLPLLLQPALAALSDADSRWTSRRLALVLSLLTLAAAVVMTVSTGSKTVLVAAYAVIGVLLVSTSPFFNSMVMEYHLRGVNVNYGLGRGTGSTTYAIVALLLGFVLEKRAPTVILPVLLAALVLQIIAVWTFRYPLPPEQAALARKYRLEPQMEGDAAIAVIGGADGPTAVFCTVRGSAEKTEGAAAATSACYFAPVRPETVTWQAEFDRKPCGDTTVSLICDV